MCSEKQTKGWVSVLETLNKQNITKKKNERRKEFLCNKLVLVPNNQNNKIRKLNDEMKTPRVG
jgi:ABC-type molybdate transport system substrate-binding protein